MKKTVVTLCSLVAIVCLSVPVSAQVRNADSANSHSNKTSAANEMRTEFVNKADWPDNNGVHINAHGGCMLYQNGTYFWYGEHRPSNFSPMGERKYGVHLYTSTDLYNWIDKGLVFETTDGRIKELQPGRSYIERPKVVYNEKTKKYVLWFHAETANNYNAASLGVAVASSPYGPFQFLKVERPNIKQWPINVPDDLKNYIDGKTQSYPDRYKRLVENFSKGQESRDMTVFVDDDGKAYVFYSSEMNATMHVAELDGDYTGFTGKYSRILIGASFEAPVVFKENGKYYLIGSHCTGWSPNACRYAVADNIFGPWKEMGNPAVDRGGDRTYEGQSCHIINLKNKGGKVQRIIMFDIWKPNPDLIRSQYMWLPLEWQDGKPVLHYKDRFKVADVPVKGNGGYLFAHFRGERRNEWEQIYFALSRDGINWEPLNEQKIVLRSELGERGVRDPFMVRDPQTQTVYLIATDLCIGLNGDWNRAQTTGSKAIIIWETHDMVNWSEPRRVEVAADIAGCTWAPEAIWDSNKKEFMVFWASMVTLDNVRQQRIYCCRTKDFRTFSPAKLYISRRHAVIDTDIVQDTDGTYYRFSKNESDKSIFMEKSKDLDGDWKPVEGFPRFDGYEGPECFRLADGRWCLLLDYFSRGQGYKAYVTDDIAHGKFEPMNGNANMVFQPYRLRHGGVLRLSEKEYNAIQKKWGSSK